MIRPELPVEEELLIELGVEGDLARLVLRGIVNLDTADELADRVAAFVQKEQRTRFLIDASELKYVSSAGVGVFLDLYDRYEAQGGRIAFVGLKPPVRRVLDLVGFMSFFGDFADEASATAYLNR